MRATVVGGLVAMLLLARVSLAEACGASLPPYYVVDEHTPRGRGAPLDAPIVVTLKEAQDGALARELAPSLVLTVLGDDLALPVKALRGAPTLSWVPLAPLAPNTTYRAHYNPGYEGIPDTVWQFTTGESETPPLVLRGELEVTLEAGTASIYKTRNNCGSDAVETGQRRVTKARVTLPSVSGGFAPRFAELHVTDDRAYDFSALTKEAPDPNEGHSCPSQRTLMWRVTLTC